MRLFQKEPTFEQIKAFECKKYTAFRGKCRRVTNLFYDQPELAAKSYNEIATLAGVSTGTVKSTFDSLVQHRVIFTIKGKRKIPDPDYFRKLVDAGGHVYKIVQGEPNGGKEEVEKEG